MNSIRKFVLVVAVAMLGCQMSTPAWSTDVLDGNAWRTWTQDERDGFVTGYYDCYVFEKGQKGPAGARREWIDAISDYYEVHPDNLKQSIGNAFVATASQRPRMEVSARRDSIFDGDLWRQMSNADRLRYVQAYMACRFSEFGLRPSRDAENYASRVSRWFGIDKNDVGVINLERADLKIGDVLSGLFDHQ